MEPLLEGQCFTTRAGLLIVDETPAGSAIRHPSEICVGTRKEKRAGPLVGLLALRRLA